MGYVLKAMPGRFVGKLSEPTQQQGTIVIPEKYRQRPEFVTVVDVGDPLEGKPEQEQYHAYLTLCKNHGILVPVSVGSGTTYYYGKENALPDAEWAWLKEYRLYNLSEPASWMPTEKELTELDELRWQTPEEEEGRAGELLA